MNHSLFLNSLLHSSPAILVYLVGIVLSLVFWARNPSISALTLISMCICLLAIVLSSAMIATLVRMPRNMHVHLYDVQRRITVIRNITQAVGLGILLLATFMKRERDPEQQQQQGFMVQPMPGVPPFRRG